MHKKNWYQKVELCIIVKSFKSVLIHSDMLFSVNQSDLREGKEMFNKLFIGSR